MAYVFYEGGSSKGASEYRFRCDNNTINGYQMDGMDAMVRGFLEKYESILRNSNMDISLKPGKAKIRGIPEYIVTINLTTKRGNFHSTDKGIGVKQAMKNAISGLQTQLFTMKSKSMNRTIKRDKDPYMVSEFLEEA
ncbi:hypothetical protein K9L67_04935 [Candidatus Woesearchaeota archaeon]|nr:hypothetical protein [Candidatus Woesearchaeota archaeon]MCF7901543.1 hypothetical protein [Candidatus Woesearchaeota archaeon]MCF8013961.1 hypothetical protein [Candidatus Woesearchaeota archaeon]